MHTAHSRNNLLHQIVRYSSAPTVLLLLKGMMQPFNSRQIPLTLLELFALRKFWLLAVDNFKIVIIALCATVHLNSPHKFEQNFAEFIP